MSTTTPEERAAQIAPCDCQGLAFYPDKHTEDCKSHDQPAIAAAIREAEQTAREECAAIRATIKEPLNAQG